MCERIVNSTWWLAVMGMICVAAAGALLVGYRGMFEVLAGRCESGGWSLAMSFVCGAAAWVLCRYRNDLL
jgi:hypothetical protein